MKKVVNLSKVLILELPDAPFFFFLVIFLSKLQILFCSLNMLSKYVDEPNWTPVKRINEITGSFYLLINFSAETFMTLFWLLQSFLWVIIINGLMIFFGYISTAGAGKYICRVWNTIVYFIMYFGGILVFSIFFRVLMATQQSESDIAGLISSKPLILFLSMSGLIAVSALNIGLLFLIQTAIKNRGFNSIKTTIHLVVETLQKYLFTLMILSDGDYHTILVLTNFVAFSVKTYFFFSRLPYWRVLANKFENFFYGPEFLLIILNIIGYIHVEIQGKFCRLYICFAVFLMPVCVKIFENVFQSKLSSSLNSNLKNPYFSASLKQIFSYFQNEKLNVNEEFKTIYNFKLKALGFLAGRVSFSESEDKSKIKSALFLPIYEKFASSGDPISELAYADFLIKNNSYELKIFGILRAILRKDSSIKIKLGVDLLKEKLKKNIKKKTQEFYTASEIDIPFYVEMQHFLTNMKTMINEQIEVQIKFWKYFAESEPDFYELYKFSNLVNKKKKVIGLLWKNFESLEVKNFFIPGLLYSLYLGFICNQPRSGLKLLMNYEKKILDSGKSKILSNETLFQSNTTFITISAMKSSLGIIRDCSRSCLDLFGFSQEELINSNISLIMSQFFAEKHDKKLLEYYKTGQTKSFYKIQSIFLKDRAGYILEGNIIKSKNPIFSDEITMIGILKIPSDQKNFVLVRDDGRIDGYSENLKKIIDKDMRTIFELSEEFENILIKINEKKMTALNLFTMKTINPKNTIQLAKTIVQGTKIYDYYKNGLILNLRTNEGKLVTYKVTFSDMVMNDDRLHVLCFDELEEEDDFLPKDNLFEIDDSFDQPSDDSGTENDERERNLNNHRQYNFQKTYLDKGSKDELRTDTFEKVKTIRKVPRVYLSDNSFTHANALMKKTELVEFKTPNLLKMAYNQASSLGSSTSDKSTEMILENVISKPLYKKKYLAFIITLVLASLAILGLIIFEGLSTINNQRLISLNTQVLDYSLTRLDSISTIQYIFQQIYIASTGLYLSQDEVLDKYIEMIEQNSAELHNANVNLRIILGNFESSYQEKFTEKIIYYDLENTEFELNEHVDTFTVVQKIVEAAIEIISNYKKGTLEIDYSEIYGLSYNILNSLIIQSEESVEFVEEYIEKELSNGKYLALIVSILCLILIVILFIYHMLIIRSLNNDAHELSAAFGRIDEFTCKSMAYYLQSIAVAVNDEIRKGSNMIEKIAENLDRTKKKEQKSKLKKFNLSKFKFQNIILVSKASPNLLLFVGVIFAIYVISIESIENIQIYEEQYDSTLDLNYESDLSFTAIANSIFDDEIKIKNISAYKEAEILLESTSRIEYWQSKFRQEDSTNLVKNILHGMACDDPLLNNTDSDYELCLRLSGGTNELGLLQIISIIKHQSEKLLYELYDRRQNELLMVAEYIHTNFETTNLYENKYLALLKTFAQRNMEDSILNEKKSINIILIVAILVSITNLSISFVVTLRKIRKQGNKLKEILKLFPYMLVLKNKGIKYYLLKNSGDLGEALRMIA